VRRRYLRLWIALKPSTWRAGRNAGGDDTRTARERLARPPAGTAPAPPSRSHLESALRRASIGDCAQKETIVNALLSWGRKALILRESMLFSTDVIGDGTGDFDPIKLQGTLLLFKTALSKPQRASRATLSKRAHWLSTTCGFLRVSGVPPPIPLLFAYGHVGFDRGLVELELRRDSLRCDFG
jgi:hypothetical protein